MNVKNDRKDYLLKELGELPLTSVNDILEANQWNESTKVDFVNWACDHIRYLSSQPFLSDIEKKGLHLVMCQYELYLIVINEV